MSTRPDMNSPNGSSREGGTYFFLFAMNNAGTTAMSQYLAARADAYLPPFGNNEGQKAPKVRRIMRHSPWDPAQRFDWAEVHRLWEALRTAAGKRVFVEASPPNILRVADIRAEFDGCARYAFSICDPYMQIASSLYNYTSPPMSTGHLRGKAEAWLERARALRAGIDANPDIPVVSYEAFCAEPEALCRAFGLPPASPGAEIAIDGKRTGAYRRVRNLAARNLGFLTFDEIDTVTEVLAPHADLLAGFGYAPTSGEALLDHLWKTAPALVHAGVLRRAQWEGTGPGGMHALRKAQRQKSAG